MIHQTPEIDQSLATQLEELDDLRRQLRAGVSAPSKWMKYLRRFALASTVQSSIEIEGYRVSPSHAQGLLSGGASNLDDENEQALTCYARAMDHVVAMADDPSFTWTDRVILDLHFETCYFQPNKLPGRWRRGATYVQGPSGEIMYEAPEAERVPMLMAEVVEWLEVGDIQIHPVVRAAMAHLHIVSVHPFRDGNGRISRIVQSLVLSREKLLEPEFTSIEEYLRDHSSEYYGRLDEAHGPHYEPARDARNWVTFCITAHLHQARKRLAQVREAAVRWEACEAIAQKYRWPDRFVIALELALMDVLTNANYRREASISDAAARIDLNRLADADLIVRQGLGRGTHYVASSALRLQVDEASTHDRIFAQGPHTLRMTTATTAGSGGLPRTYRRSGNPS